MKTKYYIAIDLKSFYASVECIERGMDPLTTNLVVADASRTEKTICLAVSPSLKKFGIPGRARLFEVNSKLKEVNAIRKVKYKLEQFRASSVNSNELEADSSLEIDFIAAVPRMAKYMEYSSKILEIYLQYVSAEDVHVYSVDEVFIDVTSYLKAYNMTAEEMASEMVSQVLKKTGITATAGVGTNLYLCKVAMDIVAKHATPNENGLRIASIDEESYRRKLWNHTPLTDFWRVGRGYEKKLNAHGLYTMGDIARCSLGGDNDYYNEELLYKLFGINAELLIDHAWGYEPVEISDIKKYKPEAKSISTGQVLHCAYDYEKTRLIVQEMTDLLVLELVDKNLVTNQIVLTIGYDIDNLLDEKRAKKYKGEITIDHYGRRIPKHAHGTINLKKKTSSTKLIMDAVMELYEKIVNPDLLARRIYVVAANIERRENASNLISYDYEQMDLFTDYSKQSELEEKQAIEEEKEKQIQQAVLSIKKKYGKNAMLRGMNLQDGATAISRNSQIGGHKA